MSLASRFELLPRPPRSRLSLGNDATRAQLPDFVDAQQLRQFVDRLFIFKLDVPGTYVIFKLGASIICLLIAVVSLISIRRILLRSFWLLRLVKRPSGTLVIPNSVLVFSVVEGVFGILFVTYLWLVCDFFEFRSMPPENFVLWHLLLWIPLIFAPIWAASGTYFALPKSLEPLDIPGQRFYRRPAFFNLLGLAIPLILAISILIPALIGNRFYRHAYQEHVNFLETYASATQLTQQMVQDAQQVWYDGLKAAKVVGITFILWTFWAFCIFIGYTTVAWRLIAAIARQLRLSQHPMSGNVLPHQQQQEKREQTSLHEHTRSFHQMPGSPPLSNTPASPPLPGNTILPSVHKIRMQARAEEEKRQQQQLQQQQQKQRQKDNFFFTGAEMQNDSLSTSFFPPVRPSRFFKTEASDEQRHARDLSESIGEEEEGNSNPDEQPPMAPPSPPQQTQQTQSLLSRSPKQVESRPKSTSLTTVSVSPSVKRSELRGAYIHLWIQCIAISPGCFLFMCAAAAMGAGTYGNYEQPRGSDLSDMGVKYERLFNCELLAKIWIACIFGAIILVATVVKTYEHAFANLHIKVPALPPTMKRSTSITPGLVVNPTGSSFFETRTRDDWAAGGVENGRQRSKQPSDLVALKEVSELPPSPTDKAQSTFSTPTTLFASRSPSQRAGKKGHEGSSDAKNRSPHESLTEAQQTTSQGGGGVWYRLWEP